MLKKWKNKRPIRNDPATFLEMLDEFGVVRFTRSFTHSPRNVSRFPFVCFIRRRCRRLDVSILLSME